MRSPRILRGLVGSLALMLTIQLVALWLILPFEDAGYEAVDDPGNPVYGALLVVILLIASAFMLLAFKYDLQTVIRGTIIAVAGLLSLYVVAALTPSAMVVELAGVPLDLLAIGVAIAVVAGLLYYPEWWVIDATGILIGGGAAALFGISFSILPILVLLVILAVYDAISVYGTKHMLTLAEGAMTMRLPVLVIIPMSMSFSTTRMRRSDEVGESPEQADASADDEMDAIFLGLGDLVIPSILIVSATGQARGEPVVFLGELGLGVEVIGAIIGSLVGLAILIIMVMRGRAHAGLPLLNGGVIAGYLVGALLTGIDLKAAIGL